MKTAFILFAALCCLVMTSFVVGEYVEADDDFEVSEVNVRDVEMMEDEHSVAITFVNKRGEVEKRVVDYWYYAKVLLSWLNPSNKAMCNDICISHKSMFGWFSFLASTLCPPVCRVAVALVEG